MQPFSTEMRVFRNVALLSHTRVTCCGSPRAPKYSHEQGEQAERTPQGQGRVKFEPKRRSSITMQHGRHRKATLKLRESHRLDRGDLWGCLPNMYGPTTQYYLATRDRRAAPRREPKFGAAPRFLKFGAWAPIQWIQKHLKTHQKEHCRACE